MSLLLYFSIFSFLFVSIKSDECTLVAICNCTLQNENITTTRISSTDLTGAYTDHNICNPYYSAPNNGSEISLKYTLTCHYVDFKNHSSDPLPPGKKDEFVLNMKYECGAPPKPTPVPPTPAPPTPAPPTPAPITSTTSSPPTPPEHHYSTGSILVIIFFTVVFGYLAMGVAVNYFLIGARGIELLPHLGFWKDFPHLIRDGVRFLQNGCVARPSELNTTSPESYDAI